jgi:hypothetical protein
MTADYSDAVIHLYNQHEPLTQYPFNSISLEIANELRYPASLIHVISPRKTRELKRKKLCGQPLQSFFLFSRIHFN